MIVKDFSRSSKYLPYELFKALPDQILLMCKNRVCFGVEGKDIHHTNLENDFFNLMLGFCEDNHGMWSYVSESCFYDIDNLIVDENDYAEEVTAQALFRVYFQFEDDANRFVKNFLVLHKLSN